MIERGKRGKRREGKIASHQGKTNYGKTLPVFRAKPRNCAIVAMDVTSESMLCVCLIVFK